MKAYEKMGELWE